MKPNYYTLLVLSFLFSWSLNSQTAGDQLFDDSYLHEIRITFDESNFWNILTENYVSTPPVIGFDVPYLMANYIEIDGQQTDSVGVRQKGFSSHFASNDKKKSIKIDINKYVSGQKIDGLKKFNLHNGFGDPAFQRDLICYDLMRKAGVAAPRVSFARLYLNDEYWGVYVIVEQIDNTFLKQNFTSGNGNLFKNMENSALEWEGNNPESYKAIFELKTNETEDNWSSFVTLLDKINNTSTSAFSETIEQYFNVDYYLRVLAVDIMTNNWDSYLEHGRNFYLYHEPVSDLFYWIPWDYNLAMGGDFDIEGMPEVPNNSDCFTDLSFSYTQDTTSATFAASVDSTINILSWDWNFEGGQSSMEPNPSFDFGEFDVYEVCLTISYMMGDSICETQECRSIDLNNNPADCATIINGSCPYPASDPIFQQVIQADPFCCNTDWDGVCQNTYDQISEGGGPGGGFTTDFPIIHDNPEKTLIKRIMEVPRFRERYLDYFCLIMDESFTMDRLEPMIDFYGDQIRESVHEESNYIFNINYFDYDLSDGSWNGNGAFIPPLKQFIGNRILELEEELANEVDYDCARLTSNLNFQDITINEFITSNDSTSNIADANGEFDDWIELHNNTSENLSLDGYYLTDNFDQHRKWPFPAGTSIAANDYMIIWADQQLSQDGFHANFRLNQEGEQLMLAHADGSVIDSISYTQQLTNLPLARIPNGTGEFVHQDPTFGFNNEESTAVEKITLSDFKIFPNPAQNQLFLIAGSDWKAQKSQIFIKNALGQTVLIEEWAIDQKLALNISNIAAGLYFLEVFNGEEKRTKKVIIQ